MDHLIVVERQFSYVKNVVQNRKEFFQESFEKSLFEGDQTAADVYLHGVTTLYKYCSKLHYPELEEGKHHIELDRTLPLLEQYLDLHERTVLILREIKNKFSNKDLTQEIINPLNPDSKIILLEWIGLNVMHSVSHVGQALRLQSLLLRHKTE